MDAIEQLHLRVQVLETMLSSHHSSPDYGPQIKKLEDEMRAVKTEASTALLRPIPKINQLASKAEVSATIAQAARLIATEAVKNDEAQAKQLQRTLKETVGEIHSQTNSAKNSAATLARYASDLLIHKSQLWGQ